VDPVLAPSVRPAGRKQASGAAQPRTALLAAGTLAAYAASALSLAVAPALPPAASLEAQAANLAAGLQDEVEAALILAAPLQARLRGTDPVDWKSFEADFVGGRARRPSQQLLMWAPTVGATERAAVEANSGRDAFRSWNIVEPNGRGVPVPAQIRPVHHPIALAAPLSRGSDLLGLDLGSAPALQAALANLDNGPTMVGPGSLLPAAACADPHRPGCAPQMFIVLPVTDKTEKKAVRGAVIVGLSWAAITESARGTVTIAPTHPTRARLPLPRSHTARASLLFLEQPFTLELQAPARDTLSVRLGRAATVRGN
jgi:CHASE1-domain containing sensor protein